MRLINKVLVATAAIVCVGLTSVAQESKSSSVVRRDGSRGRNVQTTQPGVTERMQSRLQESKPSDADLSWMRVIYRSLDLTKETNAPLYFPEEPTEEQESLFRIIMKKLANDELTAYEYLDGREVFTDQYKIKVRDMLDRFHIYHQDAKGSNEKHPKFVIEESDIPANEVLSYYVIERWEFDNRTNRTQTRIEAICPVLHRSDDFGMETVKYPMFWIKYSDLRPFLAQQNIFISDANNLPTCTYDDYFQLGLYDGDIYKTRNLRNKSMAQLYPDPEALKHAQDSIQRHLETFDDNIWVPSLDQLEAKRNAKAKADAKTVAATEADSTAVAPEKPVNNRTVGTVRGVKKPDAKPSKAVKKAGNKGAKPQSSAVRSVRNRKR